MENVKINFTYSYYECIQNSTKEQTNMLFFEQLTNYRREFNSIKLKMFSKNLPDIKSISFIKLYFIPKVKKLHPLISMNFRKYNLMNPGSQRMNPPGLQQILQILQLQVS